MNIINYENVKEISNYNPIFFENKEKFNLKEYLKINKIKFDTILHSECFICYEKLLDCKKICLPCKCNHLICYECFCKYCYSLRKRNIIDVSDKVFCPLCRSSVSNEWKKTKKVYFFKNKIDNVEIEIALPVSISDIFN